MAISSINSEGLMVELAFFSENEYHSYCISIQRQTACMVINAIIINNIASALIA